MIASLYKWARTLLDGEGGLALTLDPVIPGILAKSASYLGRLRLPLELIDRPPLPDRLAVDGVLEPFDHGFKVPEAPLQGFQALGNRCVRMPCVGAARRLSAQARLNHAPEDRR